MTTNSSAPTGIHLRCGPLRPKPPAVAGAGFELIWLKNFRSDNISAQTWVVAGSMKPPNISFVMGCPVRVASMATNKGWAADVPARIATSIDTANDCLLPCIIDLPKKSPPRQPFVGRIGRLEAHVVNSGGGQCFARLPPWLEYGSALPRHWLGLVRCRDA